MKQQKNQVIRVLFPIGLKLALIIGAIVLVSLSTVTFLNSYFVGKDIRITAEENNLAINARAAGTVEDKLLGLRANVSQLLDIITVARGVHMTMSQRATEFFFERNQDIAAIYVLQADGLEKNNASDMRIINERFFDANELDATVPDVFLYAHQETLSRSCAGETLALNASPFFELGVMALLFPYVENGRDQACVVLFSIESLSDILGAGSINTTFLINDSGALLIHPDEKQILHGISMQNHPLIASIREQSRGSDGGRQIAYTEYDEMTGKSVVYYGAFQTLQVADTIIVTTVSLDVVLEGVYTTRRNNIYLTVAVLCISIALILLFTRFAISNHLRLLTLVVGEIRKGNFNTKLIDELKVNRHDEIAVLNQNTKDERDFLNMFARFTNQGVVKVIATQSISFDPTLKDCTIFFSDIRGYTKIGDDFRERYGDRSAIHIINFLNDYMERMVDCIVLSGGNVDKFEGDAIMGVWGLLRDDDLSYESGANTEPEKIQRQNEHENNVKKDAVNAIRGTIAMRYALMKYNKDAESFIHTHADEPDAPFKPHIQIGCGLNTGRVTVGVLGSQHKMEYTAIGDAVNFAQRTETANKLCGTDILISEDTYNVIKRDYIRCAENNFRLQPEYEKDEIIVEAIPVAISIQGKGDQQFYGVVNMPQFDIAAFFTAADRTFHLDSACARAIGPSGPKTLAEVRAILNIPSPDFTKVDLDEAETKSTVSR
ncbi:MAG: adenylate/guanylate cyclase domain-containing protein [Treponema sp.]|nr:adenylate/guanylate cyclase domain-containing protein [Treponema sp.]